MVICDLDGTVWSGILGEDGPEGLAWRSEGKGAPYWVFQQFLVKLHAEGILLGCASKNDQEQALSALAQLEMPLRRHHFSAMRCNWEPKSANILAMARDMNLSPDDMVMIDDSDAELAEIHAGVPGITALRTPRHSQDWPAFLLQLQRLCGTWRISDEDRLRAAHASHRHQRAAAAGAPAGQDAESLAHLRTFTLELLMTRDAFHDPRSLELINKTNQFNFTGERVTNAAWLAWAASPGALCASARLRDRFGDFGTIGVMAGQRDGETLRLWNLVLSCRAFDRGVELAMLADWLGEPGWLWLSGPFRRTAKNEPAERFLTRLGVERLPGEQWRVSREVIRERANAVLQATGMTVHTAPAFASAGAAQ